MMCFLSPPHLKSEFFVRNEAVTLVQGNDSLSVLDRIVSTKIHDMPDLSRRDAIFCDFNGRICDIASIYTISGSILISTSDSEKESTRRKLVDGTSWDEECDVLVADSAIFRISIFPSNYGEFFEIFDVNLEDSIADKLIEKEDHLFVKYESSHRIRIDALVKFENLEKIISLLRDSKFIEMNHERWDKFRILLGIREICDAMGNLPDEMGLGDLISNDKGCYPGQEVHARLESRGRKIKSLCRLTGDIPLFPGKHKNPKFGSVSITSAAFHEGQAIALALIRIGDDNPEEILFEGNKYSIEIMGYP